MITVVGEGRGFRVAWLLEEMGIPYRLRRVDLLAGVEKDPEFLAINPAGFIPALQDGDVTMVESIAIMEYLMSRYGPTPLVPDARKPARNKPRPARVARKLAEEERTRPRVGKSKRVPVQSHWR